MLISLNNFKPDCVFSVCWLTAVHQFAVSDCCCNHGVYKIQNNDY